MLYFGYFIDLNMLYVVLVSSLVFFSYVNNAMEMVMILKKSKLMARGS